MTPVSFSGGKGCWSQTLIERTVKTAKAAKTQSKRAIGQIICVFF